jgi:DNA-binding CsgD family transcriptional regulator
VHGSRAPADGIVGREAERTALRAFIGSISEGPAGLFLEGEAGIGKTTLLDDALAHDALTQVPGAGPEDGTERGARVLACRAARAETQLSFAGLGDLFDGLHEPMSALPDPQRHALAVALLREEADGRAPDQRTVSVAALSLLRALAAESSVVIVIDDIQWLDMPSARVLEFALRRLQDEPIRLLAAIRTGDPTTASDHAGVAGRPGMHGWDRLPFPVERIVVGPLTAPQVAELIARRAGSDVPPPVARRLHGTVRGNPLYALEIVRAVEARGLQWSGIFTIPIPDDVGRLIAERVERLPVQARRAIETASALAAPTAEAVGAAMGDPDRAAPALAKAKAAGLIETDGDAIRFVHPLVGSVVYAAIPDDRRRALHRSLAGIAADPEERALHLALAATGPDPGVVDALRTAASSAHARGAPDAAAALAERALTLTPESAAEDMTRQRLEAAEYHFASGDTARARRHMEMAVAGAPAGSPGLKGLALLRMGMLRSYDDDVEGAAATLDDALGYAGEDPALAAEIHHALCTVRSTLRDTPGVVEHARAALALAEGLAHRPALLAKALTTVAYAEFVLGSGVDRDVMARALALEPAVQDAPIDELPSATFGLMLMWSDDLDGAAALLDSVHRLAVERGDAGSLATVLHYVSELESRAGRYEVARSHALVGDEAARQTGQEARRVYSLFTLALADAHLGRADEARAEAEEALALAERTHHSPPVRLPAVLGFLELSLGNAAEAHRHLEPLPDRVAETGIVEIGFHHFMPDEIEALLIIGELERAEALVEGFEERGRNLGRTWAQATAARCRGLLFASRGDLDAAAASLRDALRHHERLAQPFELARTLLVTGTVERRAKHKRSAREALGRAVEIFDGLGTALWAARAREELGRIGGRVARPWDLTPTERKVAELAAAGSTNREIADALFLSVRTVEGALSHAYHKLGVRSRTELARRLADGTSPGGTAIP